MAPVPTKTPGGELFDFHETEEKPLAFLFNSFSALNCIRLARNVAKVFLQLVLKELSF